MQHCVSKSPNTQIDLEDARALLFLQKLFWANISRLIIRQMHSKIHQINHYSKFVKRATSILLFLGPNIIQMLVCFKTAHQITLLFKILSGDINGIGIQCHFIFGKKIYSLCRNNRILFQNSVLYFLHAFFS